LKSLEQLDKSNPEFADQVRKLKTRIEEIALNIETKLRSQAIINQTLSNRIQKFERGKNAGI